MKKYFQGRMDRTDYIKSVITLILTFSVLGAIATTAVSQVSDISIAKFSSTLSLVNFAAYSLLSLPVTVKRLHDLNYAWWLVPIMYLIGSIGSSLSTLAVTGFSIYIIFKKGTGGPNEYGKEPAHVGGWFRPLFSVATTKGSEDKT